MKFKADEIASVLQKEIEDFKDQLATSEVGQVLEVGDGIARIYGLRTAMAGEMLEFPNGVNGHVFNLEENTIGVVILGNYLEISEGDEVKTTGRLLRARGRSRDRPRGQSAGQPARRRADRDERARGRSTSIAPGIAERQPVKRAVADRHQGHRLDDPHRPRPARADHRRPQDRQNRHRHRHDHQPERAARELLLRRHRPEGIDRRRRRRSSQRARRDGIHHRRRRDAADPAPLQYIAPTPAAAMAEYFMWKGEATLCVYDDLSKQAAAYRQLSLLLRRPPGREAYPGDVFYCHSRLLERAVKLSDDNGRRIADRPADHRNAGRRSLRVHPDQRHHHHRRPDLPGARPVLRRRAPGDQRRHQRLAASAATPRPRR